MEKREQDIQAYMARRPSIRQPLRSYVLWLLKMVGEWRRDREQIHEHLANALAAMGTGECRINTCDGCKDDEHIARDEIRCAIAIIQRTMSTEGEG
jgi:hypothetical protein